MKCTCGICERTYEEPEIMKCSYCLEDVRREDCDVWHPEDNDIVCTDCTQEMGDNWYEQTRS